LPCSKTISLGILKREIGVEISEQVEKALTPDLQKGWQSVEVIGSTGWKQPRRGFSHSTSYF
jgi:hypothetical protein